MDTPFREGGLCMQQVKKLKKVAIVDKDPGWSVIDGGQLEQETVRKQVEYFSTASSLLDYLIVLKKDRKFGDFPDYILIDMHLPDMDASTFLDRYEQLMGDGTNPEVFILSSSGSKKSRDLAMQYHFVSTYLEKPVPGDLIEVLIAGKSVDNSPH